MKQKGQWLLISNKYTFLVQKLLCSLTFTDTLTLSWFLIRQPWSDLLQRVICWILAFNGVQHPQLKWGPSNNNVYCKFDFLYLFPIKMIFALILENHVLIWNSILSWFLLGCPRCSSRVAAHIGSRSCRGNNCMW